MSIHIQLRKISGTLFGAISFSLGIIAAIIPVSPLSAQSTFSDIDRALHRPSIEYLAAKGVIKGYPDGTFRPWNTVNRAELLAILVNSKTPFETIRNKKDCFRDVGSEWFAPYVCHAKEQGIVSGYPNGLFRPGQKVNMAEAYAMAIKVFDFSLPQSGEGGLWYRPYVDLIHNNDIFSKFAFLPDREMSREEVAFLLHQFFLIAEGHKPFLEKRDSRSAGCGETPPKTVPSASTVNGVTRSYITALPDRYNKNTPLKLIFAFHGRTNSNADVRRYYGVERAADDQAIVVYPAGLRSGSGYTWNVPGDFALFDQLVSEFSENYCIDMDGIYAVGHSLGAYFSNSLACGRGDVIRAIGTVAGGTTLSTNCTGPVAALIMHNPKDTLVPFSQGLRARDQFVRQNRCGTTALPTSPEELSCQAYQGCGNHAPLTWCEHHEDHAYWDGSYYPHTWPRNAGREIWDFFEELDDDPETI